MGFLSELYGYEEEQQTARDTPPVGASPISKQKLRPYENEINAISQKYGIDPELAHKVIRAESNYNPTAVSKAGAMGLTQLMPGTAKDMGVQNPFDPIQNLDGGIKYLSLMFKKYNDPQKALAAYNMGPGNMDAFLAGKRGMPEETVKYTSKILGKGYQGAYANEPLDLTGMQGATDVSQVGTGGFLQQIGQGFADTGASVARGFSRGMGNFSQGLDNISTFIAAKTGLPKGGVFQAASEFYKSNADYWDSKIQDRGLVPEIVGEFIGGAAPGMAEFMLGPAYSALRGGAEGGLGGAAKEGAKRVLMGRLLETANELSRPLRTGAMAALGGAEAAAEGGDVRDIAKGAGVMAGFGAMGGPGRTNWGELAETVRNALPQEMAAPLASEVGGVRLPGRAEPPPVELTEQVNPVQSYQQKILGEAEKLTGKPLGAPQKYAASINLERLNTTEDVQNLITKVSEAIAPQIEQQRRGKLSLDSIKAAAARSGITEEKLMSLGKGSILNAEDGVASSMIHLASAENLYGKQMKVLENFRNGVTNEEQLVDFHRALLRHQTIQAAESGIATEQGRALSARRIFADSETVKTRNYKAMLEALGGEEATIEIAKRLASLDPSDTYAVNKFLREVGKATSSDKVYEYWINSLLSGPRTHESNLIGSALSFALRVPEKLGSASIDAIGSALTGKPRNRFFGEVAQDIVGSVAGFPRGVRAALTSFINEMPVSEGSKLEMGGHQQAIKGLKGKIVRLPSRFLTGVDEFFKAINFSGELHGQAYRQATQEGLTGDAKSRRMQQLVNNEGGAVSERLYEQATKDSKYRVFQQNLSPFMEKLASARSDDSVAGIFSKYVVPFVRVTVNLNKFALERTPLGFIHVAAKALKRELKPGQAADEISRALMGTMVQAAVFGLASQGLITGKGPDDKPQRDAWLNSGRQPYSIKLGDNWYSYGRFEPVSSVIGMAADISENWGRSRDNEKVDFVASAIKSMSNLFISKNWTKGIKDILDAVVDPERFGTAWIASLAGTAIPTGVAQVAQGMDPYVRDTKREGFLEEVGAKIQSRIPGLSEQLPKKYTVTGDPVMRPGEDFISRFLLPVQGSSEKNDMVNRELFRLRELVAFSPLSRSVKWRGTDVELSPVNYEAMSAMVGQEAKARLEKVMSSNAYQRLDDSRKAKLVREQMEDMREAVREKYLRTMMGLK